MAVNLSTFVHTAGLLPGGFTGISLLLQEVFSKFLHLKVPFTVFYWGLNIVPALICFKYVGKRFTLLSVWAIIASGLFTGKGCYKGAERKMLYTVVSSDEEDKLVRSIKKTDPKAFVNILQTKMLKGNFIMKKQD